MSRIKFVVLTSPRTGSTWLIDLLNGQAGIEAHGELFLRRARSSPAIAGRADYPRFVEMHGSPRVSRVPRVVSYLNRLYRAPRTVGFKLMYAQLRQYPEIIGYFAMRRVRIVHLTRGNHIDVLISEELARLTGASHAQAGESPEVPKVYLDPNTLVDRIRRLARMAEAVRLLIRLSTCQCLEVNYEAMLAGEQELERVLRFLEAPERVALASSRLAKRGVAGHRDAIANYAEVQLVLESTPYSQMVR